MKKLITLLSLVVCIQVSANNDKYRLILNDDPATTITIAWNQISGNSATVHYGTVDEGITWGAYPNSHGFDRTVTRKAMENQFARLTGLTPNTIYYFVIHDSNSTSSRFWFKTAPDDRSRLSFIAGGDSRNNRTPRQAANSLVAKLKPHAVFFGGDMTNSNSDIEWNEWFDDWQLTTASDGRMFPIIATRGNHENETTVIYDLFDTPDSNSYYGVTFGDDLFRLVTLNTELAPAGAQQTWLINDLAANSNVTWKSAQYHKPMRPHTSNKAEGIDRYNAWAQLFYDEGVRLVFESDSHTVKTTWPLEPSSGAGSTEGFIRNDNSGTVYAGEGCWGAPTRAADDFKDWTRNYGEFNQFKLVFVEESKIEMRTIAVDNAASVGEVSNSDPFTLPVNLDVFDPANGTGDVVIIQPEGLLPLLSFVDGTPVNYADGTNISLNIDILNEAAGITKVDFYVNNSLTGTDNSGPYNFTNTFVDGLHSIEAIAYDLNGNFGTTYLEIMVGSVSGNNNIKIATGDDDVEEELDTTVYFTSSDLELIHDMDGGQRAQQKVGLRFLNVDIPIGATITNAYIQFTADVSSSSAVDLEIYGEDSANAQAFVDNDSYRVSGSERSRVAGFVAWTPASWTNNAAGVNERTPDISVLLQQIIGRCDWTEGNNTVFMIEGNNLSNNRRADSYNTNSGDNAARLVYSWSYEASEISNGLEIAIGEGVQSNYSTPTNVSLDVDVQKQGLGIDQVDFYVNGVFQSTDSSAPYNYTNTYGVGSHLVQAITTDGCDISKSSFSINVGNFTTSTKELPISTGDDDVEQEDDGNIYTWSSDLELIHDTNSSNRDEQKIGLRFQNLDIPNGATINSAKIQFTADQTSSDVVSLQIYGEDTGDALGFENSTKRTVTGRTKIGTSVAWNLTAGQGWTNDNAGANERTPELSGILQQIIDRCDWSAGNSVVFMIEGTDSNYRRADSYNVDGGVNAPKLVYDYSYDATSPNPFVARYDSGWDFGIVPSINSSVTIETDYNSTINGGSIDACSIIVKEGTTLTIGAGDYLNVNGNMQIDGTLIVKHTANVVQSLDDAFVTKGPYGSIMVELTTPALNARDFMIMGSPMSGEDNTFNGAYQILEHNTANFDPYVGVPPVVGVNFHDQNSNDWSSHVGIVNPGEGYLVRPSYTAGGTYNYVYDQGTLNNGAITYPAYYGDNKEDSPNVLSNPYASAIDADVFIFNNPIVDELYFWEHNTTPAAGIPGPLSENFNMEDISTRNYLMGVAASTGGGAPSNIISTGQGFGIKANAAGNVTFNNSQRLTSGNTTLRLVDDKDLLWLEVRENTYGMGSSTGIGFTDGATADLDQGYDTMKLGTVVSLYSHLPDGTELLGIQGREAFDTSITIPMGFSTLIEADFGIPYVISIEKLEGVNLENVTIHLVDHLTNTVTNLSTDRYEFLSDVGTFNNRFTLQFESIVLGTDTLELESISIYPNPAQDVITIDSPSATVSNVKVYDLRGRLVADENFTYQNDYQLDVSHLDADIYLMRIDTDQGSSTKKLIKK